jgi:rfaE bifunctional protein kinase chain/domain
MNSMSHDDDPVGAAWASIPEALRDGGRIVFVSGVFNIIHPGHLRLLNFAASCGDVLIVGVLGDTLLDSGLPAELRLENLQAISVVHHALILDVPPQDLIARLKPHVVVKGSEHAHRDNIEQDVVTSYGGKIVFSSGDAVCSSIDLLRHSLQEIDFSNIRKPADFPARHGFSHGELVGLVKNFTSLRVVVVGDLIVDEYVDCEPLGMSREDPTLVVSPIISNRFLGGAGVVASHARGLGAQVSFVTVTGDDEARDFARTKLAENGVDACLLTDDTRPTTHKKRYRANGKTLLRVSVLRGHDIGEDIVERMYAEIDSRLADADLLIFSDFNYGCLPQDLVDRVAARCAAGGVRMVADSQASSQIGDVSRFRGMMLMTPTEHEARLALRDAQSGLVVLAEALQDKTKADYVILTLGAEGVLVHAPDSPSGILTDRLPAFNASPKDVSGAGDCFLTCSAMALTRGASIWGAAYLGSIAAACQVGRIGNLPLTADEVLKELYL